MLIGPTGRVAQRAAVSNLRSANDYKNSTAAVLPGTAQMLFFVIANIRSRISTSNALFSHGQFGGTGWQITASGTLCSFQAANSTPATVTATGPAPRLDAPNIMVGVYDSGTLAGYVNGVPGTPVTLGSGYTAYGGAGPSIGKSATGTFPATQSDILECGMLSGYVPAAAAALALTEQWMEDLQQGRELTWPRTAVADQDWHWSARDAIIGDRALATWTDRFSGLVMTRTGAPQGASIPARF